MKTISALTTACAALAAFSSSANAQEPLTYTEYLELSVLDVTSEASSNSTGTPLILGGTVVPSGTKTYTTGIRATAGGSDFCGGSLITPTHVLTAAHCMDGNIQYVSVGTHYLSGTRDGEQIKVKSKTRHPNFSSDTMAHDFLILELATASTFTPIALAAADDSDITVGNTATVMGWGVTTEDGDQPSTLLRVDVPLVSNAACQRVLDIDETMVCAGGQTNKDSCQGDSGGPLISEMSAEDVLIGVVSWGNGCG
ncbi:hypothetical protein BBJ28_00027198, partial [Nothophytophthora sp. Chile5]